MLLSVQHLEVSYDGCRTLNDVSIDIDDGGSLGVVGKSGAGKSTLAKSIIGLLGPAGTIDSGSITFEGSDISRAPTSEMRKIRGARIGYVFQNPGASFSPIRKLGVQYREFMSEHGHTDADENERVLLDTFKRLGLPTDKRILESFPFELSGGMAQRVAIAFALAMRPTLLIADEPTSALDVTVQAQVVAELLALQRDFNTALLLISHNIGMVAYACDKMAVMHGGAIIEQGDAETMLEHPNHEYTKALVDAMPTLAGAGEAR
jgi:peptide/nickel transport system ATP-binding protein